MNALTKRRESVMNKQILKFILIQLCILLGTYLLVFLFGEILYGDDMFGNDNPAFNKKNYYFLMAAPLLAITLYSIAAIIGCLEERLKSNQKKM